MALLISGSASDGVLPALPVMTVTTTASSAGLTAYLQAAKDRKTQACNLKRPTLAALRDCATALGLDCLIDRQPSKGFLVRQHGAVIKAATLADVAAALLKAHGEAWDVDAAINQAIALLCERYPVSSRATYLPAAKALKARGAVINASAILREMEKPAPVVAEARKVAAERVKPEASRFASPTYFEPGAKLQAWTIPGRKGGPSCLPEDAVRLLKRFELDLDSILTVGASNTKVAKGADQAWPVIHHTLPARSIRAAVYGLGGITAPRGRLEDVRRLALDNGIGALVQSHNGCPWASCGCQEGCLVWAGHGGISTNVASCRGRRTLAWIWNSRGYMVALTWAIARQWQQAQIKGLPLSLRLKGTDDLPYHLERFALSHVEAATLARRYGLPVIPGTGITLPEVLAPALEDGTIKWYEYSKAPVGGSQGLDGLKSAGIDVTASLAADRRGGARAACGAVRAGYRLAVPVALPKGAAIPAVMRLAPSLSLPGAPGTPGFGHVAPDDRPVRLRCVDGDITDLRYLDPQGPDGEYDGIAVILRTKVSKGASAEAEPFSLQPSTDQWQTLKGGGFAKLETAV